MLWLFISVAFGATSRASTGLYSTTAWQGGVPQTGDDVVIDASEICSQLTATREIFTFDTETPVLNEVRIESTNACFGVVTITGHVRASSVVIQGGVVLLDDESARISTTSTTIENEAVLMGAGNLTTSTLLLQSTATIAAGASLKGSCIPCHASKSGQSIYGKLSILATNLATIQGSMYLKFAQANSSPSYGSASFDSFVFSSVHFDNATVFLVYNNANDIPDTAVISWESQQEGSILNVQNSPSVYPWVQKCWFGGAVALCNFAGGCGGGSLKRSCTSGGGGGVVTSPSNGGTGNDDSCSSSSGGSITIIVGNSCAPVTSVSCGAGYRLVGTSCVPFCSVSPFCSSHGTCQTQALAPYCQCNSLVNNFGWTGEVCDKAICKNNCNGIHGNCVATTDPPHCVCNSPFGGDDCTVPTCDPVCVNGVCDGGSGAPLCNCDLGWIGADCTQQVQNTTCPPCGPYGKCPTNGTICECDVTFRGTQCNILVCPGYDAGQTPNCNSNGVCVLNGTNHTHCDCANGWEGYGCDIPSCTETYCQNNGQCFRNAFGQKSCSCPPQFTGSFCQTVKAGSSSTSGNDNLLPVYVVIPVVVVIGIVIALSVVIYRNRSELVMRKKARKRLAAQTFQDFDAQYTCF